MSEEHTAALRACCDRVLEQYHAGNPGVVRAMTRLGDPDTIARIIREERRVAPVVMGLMEPGVREELIEVAERVASGFRDDGDD